MGNNQEEWRPMLGREGVYEVSNLGQVRRLPYIRKDGLRRNGFICKQHLYQGYPAVHLYSNGRGRPRRVHILVAEAFIGERPLGYDINHIDGVKTHSYLENLEYCTRSQNIKHAFQNGLISRLHGEDHLSAKLTEIDVREIRKQAATGKFRTEIAKEYGVSSTNIDCIVNGITWKHLIEEVAA